MAASIKPGFYPALSNDAYHADSAISKSRLDVVNKSAAHYYAEFLDPKRGAREETEAMAFGSAFHMAVLEPDLFKQKYVVQPTFADGRKTAGKEERAEFAALNIGKIVLSKEDGESIVGMHNAIWAEPEIRKLFDGGSIEESYFAQDPETGAVIKCKPDCLQKSVMEINDLKSCVSATQEGFGKSASNYRYDVQGGWYPYVIHSLTGDVIQKFNFVAVEKVKPHLIGVYWLQEEDFINGLSAARRNLRTIVECRRTNIWPGLPTEPQPLQFPRWHRRG